MHGLKRKADFSDRGLMKRMFRNTVDADNQTQTDTEVQEILLGKDRSGALSAGSKFNTLRNSNTSGFAETSMGCTPQPKVTEESQVDLRNTKLDCKISGCELQFWSQEDLRRHERHPHHIWTCSYDTCRGRTFLRKLEMERHMEEIHPANFDICPHKPYLYKSKKRSNWKQHINSTHERVSTSDITKKKESDYRFRSQTISIMAQSTVGQPPPVPPQPKVSKGRETRFYLRCSFRRCMRRATRPGTGDQLCQGHKCSDSACRRSRAPLPFRRRFTPALYCRAHECGDNSCNQIKVENRPFCVSHCCPGPECQNHREMDSNVCSSCKMTWKVAERALGVSSTISKDTTKGEEARRASLLAHFGRHCSWKV